MSKPLLSIGIIFKNEIRCLERCLKSLEPLREAVPCEVVMADTGSNDGSREVAARYADILFDFPWIDDFSAARNAVMNRCSGTWYLSIDADEWLDGDLEELLRFLTRQHNFDFFGVKVRNYKSLDLEAGGLYMDSSANRLVRMSTGIRFQNPIHENWDTKGQPIVMLGKTIFHHDGYVHTAGGRKTKEERNLKVLRGELEKRPDDLKLLLQSYESSYDFPEEHMDYLRRAIKLVEEMSGEWRKCGPAIFRYGVAAAFFDGLPEIDQWIAEAEELFPNSIVTRVDVNHTALGLCWNREDYAGCLCRGEAYFQAVGDYESGNFNIQDISASPLIFASIDWQQTARCFLASAYLYEKQPEQCAQTLEEALSHPLNEKQTEEAVRALVRLHALSQVDTGPLVLALWERVNEPIPTPEATAKRLDVLYRMGFGVFRADFNLEEGPIVRPAWGLFLPLEGKCDLGRAAALYGADSLPELEEKLAALTDLDTLPVWMLAHAIRRGARFPDRPMNLEEMDALASRLAADEICGISEVVQMVQHTDQENWQGLCWARGLMMAAIQVFAWDGEEQDEEQGMALARAFAQVEREFLPRCYAAEVLRENNLFALPPLHRFGWYCAQAFEALENGDTVGYIRLLRAGLDVCNNVKSMVTFLAEHTQEVQQMLTPPELKALVDQVRVILARFDPDDPAVTVLKQSEAYQKVAYLIEGTAAPVWGGLLQ